MTNKQKQCLLFYLGYYEGEIDGSFGPKSREATEAFQAAFDLEVDGRFGPATQAKILAVIGSGKTAAADTWDDVEHFRKAEFKCKCGGKYCDGYPAEMQMKLIRVADRVRNHFDASATVSSGLRCEKHNANVGGVAHSRHRLGKAMDFRIKGKTSAEVLAYVQKQPEIRYAYAIDGSYVHMDIE